MRRVPALLIALAACGKGVPFGDAGPGRDDAMRDDAAIADGSIADGAIADGSIVDTAIADGSINADGSITSDAGTTADAHASPDAGTPDSGTIGPITGGPCRSGAAGATAFRIHWADGSGTAYIDQTTDGLPDHSRGTAGAYGYQIGFTPSYVDMFLGDGGVALDSSDFIDLDLSTAQLASISSATLAIYGRSYDTTTDGSFNWQTFDGDGYGETPSDFVSNVAPYQWYAADMTNELVAGNANETIRIKAGPSSSSLVVNQVELCVTAQ